MDKFWEIFNNLVVQSFNQIYGFIVQYGPGIAFSLALIIFGWICAVLTRKIITKLLRALGFDVLSQKLGFNKFLEKGGVIKAPSSIIGLLFYWIILLNAFVMAQDAVDLKVTTKFIQNTILYLPNALVIIILLALGVFISKFVYKFVDKTAQLANIPFHAFLGTLARYGIIGLAVIMALEHLNVPTIVTARSILVIFGVIPIVFFLFILVSGRNIIENMLVSRFIMKELKKGDSIEFDSTTGQVDSVSGIFTKLKQGNEEILIPNSDLIKKVIKKKS
ncbi:mechanosensitive ion channel domain-containing protein [Candidatus Omnitrophota bacterium]